jgi:UTP--glucose-1-phosphate uridylyltransferase
MSQATSPTPRKSVIPAAGLGTRFLPATKAVPKELLPVVDKPALQYIVEEAVDAGLPDVLVITGRGKEAIADHFDRAPELEAALEKKGDAARLEAVRHPAELAKMHYVRQGIPGGLGHAVACAEEFVGDEPFAVLLGDDIIDARDRLLARMLEVQAQRGGSVVALLQVPPEQIRLYGAATTEATDTEDTLRVLDLVEKPEPDEAPSDLAVIGRYVLAPEIFAALRKTPLGRGNELQLTDAIQVLAATGEPVHGVVFRGRRYDTGDRQDYLRAVVRLAWEREDLGPEFRAWLAEFVASRSGDALR